MDWNETNMKTLERLWLEGQTATQIAATMGHNATRSSIMGKVNRMGLMGRRVSRVRRVTTPRLPKKLVEAVVRQAAIAPLPPVVFVQIPQPAPIKLHMTDLRAGMCKWPIGDPRHPEFHFCGSASGESTYCRTHREIAYTPARSRA